MIFDIIELFFQNRSFEHIADHTPYSMNSFNLVKLTEEIEAEVTSLLR